MCAMDDQGAKLQDEGLTKLRITIPLAFSLYVVHRHRSRRRTPKGQQKCTSVPDFRRTNGSLQPGGVQWTSPRRFTHSFDSLHLGGNANLQKTTEILLEEKARKDAAEFG